MNDDTAADDQGAEAIGRLVRWFGDAKVPHGFAHVPALDRDVRVSQAIVRPQHRLRAGDLVRLEVTRDGLGRDVVTRASFCQRA